MGGVISYWVGRSRSRLGPALGHASFIHWLNQSIVSSQPFYATQGFDHLELYNTVLPSNILNLCMILYFKFVCVDFVALGIGWL